MDIVRDALLRDVPGGFATTESVVLDLLGVPEFAGWMIWPTSEFVSASRREQHRRYVVGPFEVPAHSIARLARVLPAQTEWIEATS